MPTDGYIKPLAAPNHRLFIKKCGLVNISDMIKKTS